MNKIVITNDDGHGVFWADFIKSPEDVARKLEPFRGSHVNIYEWCVSIGTKVNFISDHFELFGTGGTPDFKNATKGDQRAASNLMDGFVKKGIDPLHVVIDKVHDTGMQCYASIRANPDYHPNWMGEWLPRTFNDTFYFNHPSLRIKERDGSDSASFHLSYAYATFQERKLLLVKELCERPIDGINVDFLRHPPFVGYELPTVQRCRDTYGVDPTALAEDDPRWIQTKCSFMTEFMRQVRSIAGNKAVSVRIDHRRCLEWGLDVETWAKEQLIDLLVVSEYSGLGGYSLDLAPFIALREKYPTIKIIAGEEACVAGEDITPDEENQAASGKKVPLQKLMSLKTHCKRAVEWYDQGADGVHIFNNPIIYNNSNNYKMYHSIGDAAKCKEVIQSEISEEPVNPQVYEELGYV